MKKIRFLNILTIALLTAGMLAAAVQDVSASPSTGPDEPPKETPAPPKLPGDGDGDSGDTGDVGDSSGDKKEGGILTQLYKVVFDSGTMREAIQKAINVMFRDAVEEMSLSENPIYSVGSDVAKIVFESAKLEEIRLSSWLQLRKVAFALLPLTAALTIWASMKDGLYSVTGYANTFEAVAEFFVTIALALASYWLMDQAISLTASLTDAIASSLSIPLTKNLYLGMIVKPFGGMLLNPVMYMVLNIIAFAINLVYMGSVLIVFLSREVVLLLTVALAPLMLILGSVRPLAWLRGLWTKAFLVYLLILPVNVLIMGISYKLLGAALSLDKKSLLAMDFASEMTGAAFQLVIMAGTISVLIALNGSLGKMVYGAAIEIAKKVGTSLASVGAMAGGLAVGLGALGAGGLGAAGTAAGGTASTGGSLAPAAGGGGGLGVTAGSLSGAGSVTNTSKLTSAIGGALSSSRNQVVRSAGQGLRAGNAIKDYKTSQAELAASYKSPPINMKNGVPGFEKGLSDVTSLVDTDQKAMAYGHNSSKTMTNRVVAGGEIAGVTMRSANDEGLLRGFLSETGNLHPGRTNVYLAGREHTRQIAGEYALKQGNPYFPNKVSHTFPANQNVDPRDYAIGEQIMLNEHRRLSVDPDLKPFDVNESVVNDVVSAVYSSRTNSGFTSYNEVFDSVNESDDFLQWVKDNK